MGLASDIAGLGEIELDFCEQSRVRLVQDLRAAADMFSVVQISMAPSAARMIAADLEELTMLRCVPPTGDAG